MPSSHLILCRPLFLLPPIPPRIRVFSNESTLPMRWPKYWSFSFSIIPSKEHSGLISFRMDWLNLLAVQGTLKSLLAATAKLLQSCPTLCDPMDGSPPGSPVPGILQARTLEWVAISFSNAWKWKVKVKSLSHIRLFATTWTAVYQAPLSMGFSRQEYWSGVPLPFHKSLLRGMQIKTTMRYRLILIRNAITKKFTKNKCPRDCGEKETLPTLLVGM